MCLQYSGGQKLEIAPPAAIAFIVLSVPCENNSHKFLRVFSLFRGVCLHDFPNECDGIANFDVFGLDAVRDCCRPLERSALNCITGGGYQIDFTPIVVDGEQPAQFNTGGTAENLRLFACVFCGGLKQSAFYGVKRIESSGSALLSAIAFNVLSSISLSKSNDRRVLYEQLYPTKTR